MKLRTMNASEVQVTKIRTKVLETKYLDTLTITFENFNIQFFSFILFVCEKEVFSFFLSQELAINSLEQVDKKILFIARSF
jgi:hypothetical protein